MRPSLLFVLLLGALGCGEPEAPSIVTASRDLGPLEQAAVIQARDGGYSARVWDESVWIYGDSILAMAGEDGSSWRNNSWSHTADFDASDGVTGFVEPVDGLGAPRELLPQTEVERAFNLAHSGPDCEEPCGARWALWPGAMVWDAARARALIVYTKIYGEPGEWNFHSVGMGIATWSGLEQPVERPIARDGAEHPTLMWGQDEPNFASAAIVEGDDVYLFGCHGSDKECRLARAPLAQALDREAWRYYAGGDRWSDDPDEAAGLFSAMDMTTVHWNEHLDAYVAFYSPPFENRVMMRTSPALTGPWSNPMQAFETLAPGDDPEHFAYSGLGHAELARDGGRLEYVSYYRGTEPWFGEFRLVEVELGELGE